MTGGGDRAERFLGWLERRRNPVDRPLTTTGWSGVSRVVVIPVLAEGERLFDALRSLAANPAEELRATLVLCVVNNRKPGDCPAPWIDDNRRVLRRLESIVAGRETLGSDADLRLGFIDASSPGRELGPRMGVGEARRIGLDVGLGVLCRNGFPDGLLISLDADTAVEPGYLTAIADHFENSTNGAGIVEAVHPIPEDPLRREAMLLYEIFLRYHEVGLLIAGSPYGVPTIGSTIVVRGGAYVAAGGMNRRRAGEDFYFVQQLIKTTRVGRVGGTVVHPAARPSDRVPFGTGAAVARYLAGDRALGTLYHPDSYTVLGRWLALVRGGLDAPAEQLLGAARSIDPRLGGFLAALNFEETWPKLRRNAPDTAGFEAQFHRWFDAFRTLKLVHFLRDHGLEERPVTEAAPRLLSSAGFDAGPIDRSDPLSDLLDRLRRACQVLVPPPLTLARR